MTTIGCASHDRRALTRFEPLVIDRDYQYFKHEVACPTTYSVDETSGDEKIRREWLEWHLVNNNFDSKNYEITKREVLLIGESVIGKGYRIFYTVKVPVRSN